MDYHETKRKIHWLKHSLKPLYEAELLLKLAGDDKRAALMLKTRRAAIKNIKAKKEILKNLNP
jgi:hypothetical protein